MPCFDSNRNVVVKLNTPELTLYDQADYGDAHQKSLTPAVQMESASSPFLRFHFEVPPGSYHALLNFKSAGPKAYICGRNGPLIVLPQHNRSLFIAGPALVDWHAAAAIAGAVPVSDLNVKVLVYDHPMQCGDKVHALDPKTFKEIAPPHVSDAVIDDGAYYANFYGYGTQDRVVALQFSGALFTEGTVLVTNPPTTDAHKPPLIVKDVTTAVLEAAILGEDKLACVPGF